MGFGVKENMRWAGGIIPYHFLMPDAKDKLYPAAVKLKGVIERCMGEWMAYVNSGSTYITFVEKPDLTVVDAKTVKHIQIKSQGNRCGAGDNGAAAGPGGGNMMTITVENEALWNSVPHELGHVIGLSHENEQNGLLIDTPYKKGDVPRMCYNLTRKQIEGFNTAWLGHEAILKKNVAHGDYDPGSIMHYPAFNHYAWNCPSTEDSDPNLEKSAYKLLEPMGFKKNYPTADEVKAAGGWAPSKGDIEMIRWMYAKTAVQKT